MSKSRFVWGRRWAVVLGVSISAVLALAAGRAAAVTTVDCNSPGGAAAFQAALTAGGTVNVSGTCDGTFTASANVTVNGSPSATLDAQSAGRPLTVASGKTVTLNNLTITGGSVSGMGPSGAGGGVFGFLATLTLNNCLVTGNTASAGGGIASGSPSSTQAGFLTLNSSQVTNNTAEDGGGGGILNHNGTATLNNSVVSGNQAPGGGGIASGNGNGGVGGGGTLTVTDSQVSGNNAFGGPEGGGGGIANGGSLTMTGSSVTGNLAVGGDGGGILSHGNASISNSLISSNGAPDDTEGDQGIGGGIFNTAGAPGHGNLSIDQSQVTRNTAGLGGGIASGAFGYDASVTISNSAVSMNRVTGEQSGGGGIANVSGEGDGYLTINGSTMVGNLARGGLGGAIVNVSQGGEALVDITSTTIGSTSSHAPYTINPNQAAFGGGIFNWAMSGPAGVTLGSHAVVVGNQASVDGGGVFNADGATLTISGGNVLLNHPDNVVDDPSF